MGNYELFNLDEELLNLSLDAKNLRLKIRGFVGGDRGGDNGTRNTTSTTKSSLGRNEDVRDVLIFTEKRQVKENFKRLGISYFFFKNVRSRSKMNPIHIFMYFFYKKTYQP